MASFKVIAASNLLNFVIRCIENSHVIPRILNILRYARIKLSIYETKIRFVAASQGFVRTLFPISTCRVYQGDERR